MHHCEWFGAKWTRYHVDGLKIISRGLMLVEMSCNYLIADTNGEFDDHFDQFLSVSQHFDSKLPF